MICIDFKGIVLCRDNFFRDYWLCKKYKNNILFVSLDAHRFRKMLCKDGINSLFYIEYTQVDIYEWLFSEEMIDKILQIDLDRARWFLKSEKVTYFYKSLVSFVSNLEKHKNVSF